MKFELLSAQINQKSWVHPVLETYKTKINPMVPMDYQWIKLKSRSRKDHILSLKESEKMFLEALSNSAYIISLDERGCSLSSEAFAKKMNLAKESGKSKVQWVVGGPYGLGDEIRKRSDLTISLSQMVFNQEVALTVISEQIYRGLTITHGLPYHNN